MYYSFEIEKNPLQPIARQCLDTFLLKHAEFDSYIKRRVEILPLNRITERKNLILCADEKVKEQETLKQKIEVLQNISPTE